MEKIKLGSMYFGRQLAEIGSYWNNQALTIGDTNNTHPITWVKTNGLLIADHTICTNISWDSLNQEGFIFGKPIRIDDKPYLCRSLRVGVTETSFSEWDDALIEQGNDDRVWHWSESSFWGQEVAKERPECRVIRGFSSAYHWGYDSPSYKTTLVGFRPVLNQMGPEPLISDVFLGQTLKIYGPDGAVSGKLIDYTEYDIILESAIAGHKKWCDVQEDGSVIIDRSFIIYTGLV